MKPKLFFLLGLLAAGQLLAQAPQLKINSGHADMVNSVCFSPDDKYIASGSSDKTVKLWDVSTYKELKTFTANDEITSVMFSPDGKYLYCTCRYNGAVRFEISTGKAFELSKWSSHFTIPTKDDRSIIVDQLATEGSQIALIDSKSGEIRKFPVGHLDYIWCASLSPDGRYVASGSGDKTVKLWDMATGAEIRTFRGHHDKVGFVNFSPDGRFIVSGSQTDTIRIWEVSSGRNVLAIGHSPIANSVCFSPDGRYIVEGRVYGIGFWDVETGKLVKTYRVESVVNSVSYSHDGRFLVYGTYDKTIGVWDTSLDNEVFGQLGKKLEVERVFFSPDGKTMINENSDSYLKQWNIHTAETKVILKKEAFGAKYYYDILDFSKDHGSIAYSCSGKNSGFSDIGIYRFSDSKEIITLLGHTETVSCASFSPDGRYIASGSGDKTVKLWDIVTGKEVQTFKGHNDIVECVNFSPDGKYIVSGGGSDDETVRVWKVSSRKEFLTLKGHSINVQSVCFSPDGKYIVSGSSDGNIKVWNALTGQEERNLAEIEKSRYSSMVSSVVFSPDGKYLVSGHYNRGYAVKLWNFETGQLVRAFEGHTGDVNSVQFSPDGKYIASGSADGSTKIWDVTTGQCLITRYDVPNSDDWVAVTPDGRFDGTDAGMKLLYYVKDLEVIPLESFYERFYTPGLAARVFSGSTEVNAKHYAMGSDIKLPPSVRIVSPMASDKFKTDLVEVVVEATDQGGGVDEVRLYQNGKLVSEEQRGFRQVQRAGEKITKKYSVLLASGMNEFKATAFNTDRTESVPYTMSIELQKAISASNLYLVAIGVNTYKNAKYSLTYSVADAEAFSQTVAAKSKGIFSSVKTVVLKDEQCTKTGILAKLDELSGVVKPEDVFIFYYAGHGVMSEGSESIPSEFYFAPYDVTQLYGNDDILSAKGISASELRKALINVKAQKQLIVMDACQSGGATELLAMRGAAEEKALMQLARSAGIAVLSSTGTEQFASEVKQLGHGVFTYSLLSGLNGQADGGIKDGKITIKELAAFLEDNVPELTKQYRGTSQYPNTSIRGMDFPIVVSQ